MTTQGKIKILETIRQGQVGGGETHVLDLVRKLNKDLFEVEVLSFTDGPMVHKLNALGINTYVIETEKPFDVSKWSIISKFISDGGYDIVHAHGTRAASNVFYSDNKLNIPLIYTVHGWSFHDNQNVVMRKMREFSENFLTKRARTTITVSESNKKDGIAKFDLERAQVIYNGIDHEKFNPSSNYSDIRAEFGIPTGKTLVGYLVRMTKQKDPFTMVRAVKEVSKTNRDIIFLMVGNGELLGATKKLASELEVSEQIIFSDFRNDIPAILQAIDIYCLPSLWEGMPIGLLEAMAMGKACIASAVDGTKELVNDGENGILIEPKDPHSLARHIVNLHLHPEGRKALGNNAMKHIQKYFSLDQMVNKIEQLYIETVRK
ncbi:MAG: glycosyltransferase family 4 protein [Bacteroidetes bacterium]|nr:glycosyltransferase family 4 protein [Bacteroidota bacterium]